MDINVLNEIDMPELGRRLSDARRRRGMTQEEAAAIIDVGRTTMVAIEKGERRVKASELLKLSEAYGRDVSDFVREQPVFEPFQVQFRGPSIRTQEHEDLISPFIDELEDLSRNFLQLEQIANEPISRRYPQERDITKMPIEVAAESAAIEERNRLGLGDGPISILRDVLEQDVGLRIFYLPLPSNFSEIYFFNDTLGGCIAININHPEERRRWSLSHAYGHFLAHRYKPSVLQLKQRIPDSERFADSFAAYFLMPSNSVTQRYNYIIQQRERRKPTYADLFSLAHYYGVSHSALAIRLENMKLIPFGTSDRIQESGIKISAAYNELQLMPLPARDQKLPLRYQFLAIEALREDLIGEAQFAKYFGVDLVHARRIAEVLQDENDFLLSAASTEFDFADTRNRSE